MRLYIFVKKTLIKPDAIAAISAQDARTARQFLKYNYGTHDWKLISRAKADQIITAHVPLQPRRVGRAV